MYNRYDYPYMGDIVRIELTDSHGFINNVFGADTLINLMQPFLDNGLLLGVMIIHEIMEHNTNKVIDQYEIYLLNEDNLIIHDTAFLAGEELNYIDYTSYDRPECMNDFSKNIDINQIRKGLKIRHTNGIAYIADKTRTSICVQNPYDENDLRIFQLANKQHMEQFHNEYHGFLNYDSEESSNSIVYRRTIRKHAVESEPEAMTRWFEAIKILAESGNERLRQMASDIDTEKRRSRLTIIENENDK